MPAKRKSASSKDSSAHLGFEAKLWLAADKLRNNMDAVEYKHVVLGLIFLKYISDSFEEHKLPSASGRGAGGEGFWAKPKNKETPDPGTAAKDGRRAPGVHIGDNPRILTHTQG